jgi:hypothetical protein
MSKKQIVLIALFAVAIMLGAVSMSMAAAPAVPWGTATARENFPKPVADWFERNVFNKFTGTKSEFFTHPDAPFDIPFFYPPYPEWMSGVTNTRVTTDEDLINFIKGLPTNYMRWDFVGNVTTYDLNSGVYSPLLNFGYPVVVFSKGPDGPVFDPEELRALGKPIYCINGPIHGNEHSGVEATISTMKRLAYDEYKVLDKISVIVIPRMNIDGSYWNTRGTNTVRGTARGMDMNRDGTMFLSPQNRLANMIHNAYKPHMSIDLHETAWHVPSVFNATTPSWPPRYYPSGEYGVGNVVSIDAIAVPVATGPGVTPRTMNIGSNYMYYTTGIIATANEFHNTPDAVSNWQRKMLAYVKQYFESQNMYAMDISGTEYATYARKPDGVDVVSGDQIIKMPGDVPQWLAYFLSMPDECYGSDALGLKHSLTYLTEIPGMGSGEMKIRMYNQFLNQQAQMFFLAEHSQEILNDLENAWEALKTDRLKIALWNWQTFGSSKQKIFNVVGGNIADVDDPNRSHYYEFTMPYVWHNLERKAGKTVDRPYAYIIDPEHVANGDKINADLAVFRLSYTGIPVYRLTEEVTVTVEGNIVGNIQSLSIGNTFSLSPIPAFASFDNDGNYTGTPVTFTEGDIMTTYLGGLSSVGSSSGLQSQRIVSADTYNVQKTFPAGSYVIPVGGNLTNKANLHAILAMEVLGKRNFGNSYHRFRPGNYSEADAAQEWPYPYRKHYFPVASGSDYPAYRYMLPDYEKALSLERVFTAQPFINGANFAAGYPVSLSILKGKGLNLGAINKIGLGYHFKAEGTSLTELNPKADQFYVTIPTKYDGVTLGKWYLYDWNSKAFAEVTPGTSKTSGAKIVTVQGQYINSESDIVLIAAPFVVDITKLPFPNLNILLDKDVTVIGKQNRNSGNVTVEINNNALNNGDVVTFFFVRRGGDFVTKTKAVSKAGEGIFEVTFTADELKDLKHGVTYAIQYVNADGTAKGFSTLTKGAFLYTDLSDSGCDAGLGYAAIGLIVASIFARKRSK